MKLTGKQIASYAQQGGFNTNESTIAVAIALAESGGETTSHNSTPPDDSYGLWQINMLGAMGPDRRKKFGITKNEELFDPLINAKAAHTIYGESGWKAWTTYTSGKYKQFLTDPVPTDATADQNAGITGSINNIGLNIFKALSNMTGFGVGLALIVVGILVLARNAVPAKKIVKAVT